MICAAGKHLNLADTAGISEYVVEHVLREAHKICIAISNVCDVGYSSCAEKCRRHTHWCRAGAEDALIGPVKN